MRLLVSDDVSGSLDDILSRSIVRISPIVSIVLAALCIWLPSFPTELSLIMLVFSLAYFGLYAYRNLITSNSFKFLYVFFLYAQTTLICLISNSDINQYYLLLVSLTVSLFIYRNYYLQLTLVNVVLMLFMVFTSVPLSSAQRSTLFFNYTTMAIVALIAVYLLWECIYVEQEKTSKVQDKLELNNQILKDRNKKLQEMNQSQKRLLAVISHDVKNPIDSLLGLVDLLQKDMLNEQELKSLSTQLHAKLTNTSNNLQNIVEWGSSQMNNKSLEQIQFNIKEATRSTIQMLSSAYERKNIKIHLSMNRDMLAYGDENAFKAVIRNLLTNACKFTFENGRVDIEAKSVEQGSFYAISVSDTGMGMSREQINNLFQNRDSHNGTKGEKGNGIGLTIVKQFSEANGGKVYVESEEGKGTTITFTIPSSITEKAKIEKKPDSIS